MTAALIACAVVAAVAFVLACCALSMIGTLEKATASTFAVEDRKFGTLARGHNDLRESVELERKRARCKHCFCKDDYRYTVKVCCECGLPGPLTS